ncbi:MAG TPA: WXG100 family type VII secretion target [Pseudonocardiaceae bacterium]
MSASTRGWHASVDDLHQMATRCDATAEEIQSQLAHLRSFVQDLETQWKGVASVDWVALMDDYNIYANMLHQSLTGIGQGLRGNAVNYAASEESALANVRQVHGALPTAPAKLG